MKISLDSVQETLLIPLWARAEETLRDDPIIRDEDAVSIVENISYDFAKFKSAWMSQVGVSIRAMLLDKATKRFIDEHDEAVIINIGTGLDTRFKRLAGRYRHWYDLDMPDVIDLRKHFFQDTDNYTMIGKSVFDHSWIKDIAAENDPVLIIAEGVLMYFEETEVRELMNILTKHFSSAEMLFDTITPFLVNRSKQHDSVKYTNASFKWGIWSGIEIETMNNDITFVEEWNYYDYYEKRWKWLCWPLKIPAFKRRINNSIIHVTFNR